MNKARSVFGYWFGAGNMLVMLLDVAFYGFVHPPGFESGLHLFDSSLPTSGIDPSVDQPHGFEIPNDVANRPRADTDFFGLFFVPLLNLADRRRLNDFIRSSIPVPSPYSTRACVGAGAPAISRSLLPVLLDLSWCQCPLSDTCLLPRSLAVSPACRNKDNAFRASPHRLAAASIPYSATDSGSDSSR